MTNPLPAARDSAPPLEAPGTDFDIAQYLDGATAFFGAAANVIMQLAQPPVGYGVVESTVDSGKVTLHPIKRLRTTVTYLSVAMLGDEEERAAYRDAVNRAHRAVRSTAASPVRYNAFDPTLQLWVAACLYWGARDMYERLHGPMDEQAADAFYYFAARLGTTLQMRPEMWPADRAAFDAYWTGQLARTRIDPPVRAYFDDLIDLKMLPLPARLPFARFHRWVVTGMLPPQLRAQMDMRWSAFDDQLLETLLHGIGAVSGRMPRTVRMFPVNAYLADFRLRRRLGLRLV
ncbi:oxygenase MpaB family protein [Nocardia goodfellowii]|uniref:Uncharacterized protein (DUF2236 family) n=1 Tax=Nocardia goodfellowii TaxID=882446 RepID=A0ABS4QC56_9NOCA|nr:oxygenase MpaB family protein [Nocardia goodfellowii]MBP2189272.1 uncharacterized protein (DUF2236 family) [Nocardia goodfellowii]